MDKENNNKLKFSDYFYNGVTYAGIIIAGTFFAIECLLFGLEFLSKNTNIYLGIVTYVILPPFLVFGLILIPLGAFWKKRRVSRGLSHISDKKIYIDLSKSTHRNAIAVFIIGTVFLIIMTTIGSYKAFQYTESVAFCGLTCHKVMSPQHTAYLNSPHARVKCVECHIGEGVDWYLHYKLAGARQLYHFIKNDYPKPIPTPVTSLRPASETCERCHWPDKFYGAYELKRTYYSSGPDNQKWNLRMLINVGNAKGKDSGIHAHMYIDNDIYYAAEDEANQKITWVKSVGKDGKPEVFTTADSKFKDTSPPQEVIRKMDCIDCHNRPTHHFNPPYLLVNKALSQHEIDPAMPSIKSKLMELLSARYSTTEEAEENIGQKLITYYQKEHPEYYALNEGAVLQAVEKAKQMYKNNFFPEMNTRWDNRPDNIGHMWTAGCFRCHDDQHQSMEGKIISKDCTSCHTIIEQGSQDTLQSNISGLEFIHPFEDDGLWKEMNCFDCHTGS